MSIFSVQNTSQTNSIDSLASLLPIPQTASDTTTASSSLQSSDVSSSDTAHISKLARLFSKLQSLSTSNPAKFKQVTADFAAKLKAEAANIGGPQGQYLSNLADKFSQASQTGDVSRLKPQAPAINRVQAAYTISSTEALSAAISGSGHKHHGHHHASSGSSSNSSSPNSTLSDTSSTDSVASLFQQLTQELSAVTN